MPALVIRPLEPSDRAWVREKTIAEWGAEIIVVRGEVFHPAELPGYAAWHAAEPVGLITCRCCGDACEVISLATWGAGRGSGIALLRRTEQDAREKGCRRLSLVTTNDNSRALRFYQRLGFTIAAVRLNVMDEARQLKAQIPLIGEDGIPIRDEIELEMRL